jgi:hypothetical protein
MKVPVSRPGSLRAPSPRPASGERGCSWPVGCGGWRGRVVLESRGKDGIDVREGPDRRTAARLVLASLVLASAVFLAAALAACGANPPTTVRPFTPTPPTVAAGTATMAITPGPQAAFVPVIATATGVNRNGAPIHPTSTFALGTPVYLICRVQGIRPGEVHRLTVRWYINGQLARSPGSYTYATVAQDGPLSFRLIYTTAGEGVVKLYWDEPVGDSNEQPTERYLAQAITFTLQ